MRRTAPCLWVLAVLLAAPGSSARSQEFKISPSLAQYLALVDVRVQSGRIVASSKHNGRSVSSSSSSPRAMRSESLTLRIVGGVPTLNYALKSKQGQLAIDVDSGNVVKIRREPPEDSEIVPLEFDQRPGEDLRLVVGRDSQAQTFEAASLWHLLLIEPELCRAELVPLLEAFDARLSLMSTAAQIEERLVRWALTYDDVDAGEIRKLVAQLESDQFARRRAAERRLIQLGQRAAPALLRIDPSRAGAETRQRLRRILTRLDAAEPDTPRLVAPRLASDPTIWLALMARPAVETRRIAAERLAHLLDRDIAFDPAAAAEQRQRQIERLDNEIR